ncbi:CoA-binding domain protein, partial [mine drainage metagenome]
DIFRPSDEAVGIVEKAISIGVKAVWLQLGIRSKNGEALAMKHGVRFVMDRCMMIEYNRLYGSAPTPLRESLL